MKLWRAGALVTAAAGITKRVELGLLVSGNTYRNPALLAKMSSTIDHISHGRYILGIGAAWYQQEHTAYGWRFPGLKERCDRLVEALDVIKLLFTAGEGTVNYTKVSTTVSKIVHFLPNAFRSRICPFLSEEMERNERSRHARSMRMSATSTSIIQVDPKFSSTRFRSSTSIARILDVILVRSSEQF